MREWKEKEREADLRSGEAAESDRVDEELAIVAVELLHKSKRKPSRTHASNWQSVKKAQSSDEKGEAEVEEKGRKKTSPRNCSEEKVANHLCNHFEV